MNLHLTQYALSNQPMNNHIYLISKDLDPMVCEYLDPVAVLTMTEVNMHYQTVLATKQQQFNCAKLNFETMCKKGYLWIAKWYEKIIYELRIHIKQNYPCLCTDTSIKSMIELNRSLIMACKSNNLELIKWLKGLQVKKIYGKINVMETIRKETDYKVWNTFTMFSNACRYGNKDIIEFVLELGHHPNNILQHGIHEAFKYNVDTVRYLIENKKNIELLISADFDYIIDLTCLYRSTDVLEFLNSVPEFCGKLNPRWANSIFLDKCKNGHIDMAKTIYNLKDLFGPIDIRPALNDCVVLSRYPHIINWLESLS